ncbi:hypothetical protein [Streptomyces sp. TLI_171]|uniref:hypothetical protein n=1 Tax=Streptomyces sp. TLI_171 TaxID=1938859 RepID=UPI000C194863|nr:hypothetical protein [Streptomyces sp. TLI_171]RKE05021.1 hypothetical protein BX266_7265 [Streptomyces sp. TLI_171]
MTYTHDPADDGDQPGERRRPLPPAQVEDLVERAVEAIVTAPSADTVLTLVDDLDRGAAL